MLVRSDAACRCYVNPMTCQHKPFLANGDQVSQAWDSCMGPGMNTTIDSGDSLLSLVICPCSSLALIIKRGTSMLL